MLSRILIIAALLVILGVPLGVRLTRSEPVPPVNARRLVVITPHVPQIRREFGQAFARWHQRKFGEPVIVDWRSPGAGTTEIIKILAAQYTAAAKDGRFDFSDPKNPKAAPGTIAFDMMFGGGSFDHNRLKTEVKLRLPDPSGTKDTDGKPKLVDFALPISAPACFSQAQLDDWFGENQIGAERLYDPDQFWLGTALSGFGIVYNRDSFKRLGLDEPLGFQDLTSPLLQGELILADPRQSGSVTTAIDSILNAELWNTARREGWEAELDASFLLERKDRTPWEKSLSSEHMASVEHAFTRAWRTLREICANSRAYTAAATRPPIDVSAGEGAAGLAIDFYGRGQAQAVLAPGQSVKQSRVWYVDPQGAAYIDADPASILRGGPEPQLAKRFLEFTLSDEGQALWNFPTPRTRKNTPDAFPDAPLDEDRRPMGPEYYELRRLPIKRSMYEKYLPHLIDQLDPFTIASGNRPANWRPAIGVMVGAFSIDLLDTQREAWRVLNLARVNSAVAPEKLAAMEAAFYAFPETPGKDGQSLAFSATNFRAIREVWRPSVPGQLEIKYTNFFRDRYNQVIRLANQP